MLLNWHYELFEGMRGGLETWKRTLKSKKLRANVKRMRMMISSSKRKISIWCLGKGCGQ